MPLEALIAEDEELLRQSLVEQLRRLWPELKLVAECEDGASALEQLAEKQPDIAFLDIRMPGISGIEVARSLFELSPRTDRKSTRLNSSHSQISYAVFCLKKKKNKT